MFFSQVIESEVLKCSVLMQVHNVKIVCFFSQGLHYLGAYEESKGLCNIMKEKNSCSINESKPVFQIHTRANVVCIRSEYGDFMSLSSHGSRNVVCALDRTAKAYAWVVVLRDLKNPQGTLSDWVSCRSEKSGCF